MNSRPPSLARANVSTEADQEAATSTHSNTIMRMETLLKHIISVVGLLAAAMGIRSATVSERHSVIDSKGCISTSTVELHKSVLVFRVAHSMPSNPKSQCNRVTRDEVGS